MRIWLDPSSLPSVSKQQLNAPVIGPSRLQTPEEFGDILLKVNPDGSQVRLHDVATVNLGGENYSTDTRYNGKPASVIAVNLHGSPDRFCRMRTKASYLHRLPPHRERPRNTRGTYWTG
jgi:multidrug efflux pump